MTSTTSNILPRIPKISPQNNSLPLFPQIPTSFSLFHDELEDLTKLPKDPLLAAIYSKSPLGFHLSILEKVQTALIRGSKADAIQFLKSNEAPLPKLPSITENQATVILENLSKKMSVLIQKPNLSIEFTPLDFFLYLLKETSNNDNKLPEILDIECIGSHALTLLPGIKEQIFQTLLEDFFQTLDSDVFKDPEEKRGHLEYRIKIPSSTLESFDNYSKLFAAFLCKKAKKQPVEIPVSMIETFVKKRWLTPLLFYEDCHASISVNNLDDQNTCTFIISQRPKESNLFKNTLNVSVKSIIEKVNDLSLGKKELFKEELQEMFLKSMKTENFSPSVLRNDAKAFWKTQFDRLPPFTDSIDDITDTLATIELWLACVNRLTKRVYINEPIAPHILYGGWLENIWEMLNGNHLANNTYEKRLLDASFQSLNNLLHPEEIQKQLDTCLTSKKWEKIASYLLKKITGNDFNLSIAMLVQSSLVLLRNGYETHIKDLWLALFPRLNTIHPSKDSPPTLWTHIYECIKENRDSFKAIAALLEIKAFLLLFNKSAPNKSKIQALNCPFETSPALRLSDGTYSLHLYTNLEKAWETLYEQLLNIKTTKSFEALCLFINSAIEFHPNPDLNFDFTPLIPCIEQFITKKNAEAPCWHNLALEGLLACYMQTDKDSWYPIKKIINYFQFTNPQEHVFIKNHLGKHIDKNFLNKQIPIQLLCALALASNITPQTYQSDIFQAFNLWDSYNQIEPKQFSKFEQELLLKIAPYRPDLATNMLKALLDKNLLSSESFYPFIKKYSASISTTLKTAPWKDDPKLYDSIQKISENLLENIEINLANIPLILEAIQLAIYSNHLLLGTQKAATLIKLECSDQYNNSLEHLLLQILKKIATHDQNLLYAILKQITHSPKLQQLIDQAPEKFFPLFSELSNHLVIADDIQRQIACNFFRLFIHLCDKTGKDIADNYSSVLPLANLCLSQAPASKSAFCKCLWMFQKPLQEAASKFPEKNVNLNVFFQRPANTSSSKIIPATEDFTTLSESEVLLLLEKMDLKLILQEITKDSEHPESIEKHLQSFKILEKLKPPLPIQKILGLLLYFFDATFSLVKDKESEQSIKIAVKLWNLLEGLFHQAEREQDKSLMTQENFFHYSKRFANYKLLLNGLIEPSDLFNTSLKSIKTIVENCDIFSFDLIFNDSLKYLPLLPKKRVFLYLESILDQCMPLLIKLLNQQKSDPPATTRTPYQLLAKIGQISSINKCSKFIQKLSEINSPLATGCALCLAHGLFLSNRELPLKVKLQIIKLLENTPWEAANYFLLCLASAKENISPEKRTSLIEKNLEKIENAFPLNPNWTIRYAGLCRVYLDTWLYQKNHSPITPEAAAKIIQRLSYLSVFETSFPFKNYEKTITALKANCDHLKTVFPLGSGELELCLLNNILSQPIKKDVLFYQLLTNSFDFLQTISKDIAFNCDRFHKEIYTLATMGISDSCLSDASIYKLYYETVSKLYTLLQAKHPSYSSDILTLISNFKSSHLDPQCAKAAFECYLKDIKRTYQNSKYQKLREGVMHCNRLMFIAKKGIEEKLFQAEASPLFFEIAEFIGDVALDYHNSKQFFPSIHLMAMQAINHPLLKNNHPAKRLEILVHWCSRLITCKSENVFKAVEELLSEIFSDFFMLYNKKTLHNPNILKEANLSLKKIQQLLSSLPNVKYPEAIYKSLFDFALEIFPDSSFIGSNCKEEYSSLNQSIKNLLSEIYKKTPTFPCILTLLFIDTNFNSEEKSSAFYEVISYLEKIKTDYLPAKNGYMCFKRVFFLLLNCQMKGLFQGHYSEYLEMIAFLTDITMNSPEKNFLEEMKVSITLLLNLNTRNLSEEELQLQKKAIVIWNKRLEQLRDSFNC